MITWIPVEQGLPNEKDRIGNCGEEYTSSDMVLLFTDDPEEPIALGCLEDGKWFIDGVGGYDSNITHWALINQPDGHLLAIEYTG